MIEHVVTRCAGGCRAPMTQEEAIAHATVVCVTTDDRDRTIGTLTLAVCDDCAAHGGRERAEIVAIRARAIYAAT